MNEKLKLSGNMVSVPMEGTDGRVDDEGVEETITVTSMLGHDKEITKEEFINLWRRHANELHSLVVIGGGSNDLEEVERIVTKVQEMAERRFYQLYEKEHG